MEKQRIAIVGAGFSGLALAYHLLRQGGCHVCLFEKKAIGGGASGIATGLVHPYPGEQARRSWMADAALLATRRLLDVAQNYIATSLADFSGIERIVADAEHNEIFLEHSQKYGDVAVLTPYRFLIASGITIKTSLYLEGLWKACQNLGATIDPVLINNLEELKGFDQIVIAAGAGIAQIQECSSLRIKLIKGQMIAYRTKASIPLLSRSIIAKGYVTPTESGFCLGSTYEREFFDEEPCIETALKQLQPKLDLFFPEQKAFQIDSCKAGVRVMNKEHYLPIVGRLKNNVWLITAMGSRGLLYHAYCAEKLSEAIVADNDACIPDELKMMLLNNKKMK